MGDPVSGSRLTSVPGVVLSGQKPGSNTLKTDNFPRESESSFVEFVRGGG